MEYLHRQMDKEIEKMMADGGGVKLLIAWLFREIDNTEKSLLVMKRTVIAVLQELNSGSGDTEGRKKL